MAEHDGVGRPREPDEAAEPIAVIGAGVRLPGGPDRPDVEDLDAYWRLLAEGRDVVTEVPPDRWAVSSHHDPTPGRPGRSYSRWGGFLENVRGFDAAFFGISAPEADHMDPQQRMLLEVAWHALEDAGVVLDDVPARSAGDGDIGVFVGVSTNDYSTAMVHPRDHYPASPFTATGGATSIAANRVSHTLGLRGPSLAVDTACSSSLVALHLACESLRRGECELAIAAGVNFILAPENWIAFCGMGALSATGRCRAFDASADGFVRSEGAGAVLLRRATSARAAGQRIRALICATGVNQDGATPSISMPDGEAQERLALDVCRRAGVDPSRVSYVEAHGTGTPVGDPVEATAIGRVFGRDRPDGSRVVVGSSKTNLGHLEAGAGIAGLIKAILVLERRTVPPHVHLRRINPKIDLGTLGLEIPSELRPLGDGDHDDDDGPAKSVFAAVNSFGFGGTNAHALIRSADPDAGGRAAAPPGAEAGRPLLLPLSAESPEALIALATAHRERLEEDGADGWRHCAAAARRRRHGSERLAVVAEDANALAHRLGCGDEAEESSADRVTGRVGPDPPEIVFVFSGQGAQWWAMGRQLYAGSRIFRERLEQCHAEIESMGDLRLLDELLAGEERSRLHETAVAQPAIFALQVALAALWESWGIRPAAVVGHSVGEIAAAHLAGALTLSEAARVIYHRGRSMAPARGGRMIAAGLDPDEAEELLAGREGELALAAVNGPRSVSIAGDAEAVESLRLELERRGTFCRQVPVEYAFHSSHMDPVRSELANALAGLEPSHDRLPFYSTVTGERLDGCELGPDYWFRNVRQRVAFAPAIRALVDDGHRVFLEVSAHPVLGPSLKQCLEASPEPQGVVLPSLHRGRPEWLSLSRSLAALYCLGADVDWSGVYPEEPGDAPLPLYPWQRHEHWAEAESWTESRTAPQPHPLLARAVRTARPCWETWLDLRRLPYLADHVVDGRVLFPAAGFVEVALAAARELLGDAPCVVEEVELHTMLRIADRDRPPLLQLTWEPAEGRFEIASRDGQGGGWHLHCSGKLRTTTSEASTERPARPASSMPVHEDAAHAVDADELYRALRRGGLEFGPAFRGLRSIRSGDLAARAHAVLPESTSDEGYRCHPALLDAAFQTVAAALPEDRFGRDATLLPVAIESFRLLRPAGRELEVVAVVRELAAGGLRADLELRDRRGPVAVVRGFHCRGLSASRSASAEDGHELLRLQWRRRDLETARPALPAELPVEARGVQPDDARPPDSPAGDELTRRLIEGALLDLGWSPDPGEEISLEALAEATGAADAHRATLGRWLELLAEDDAIEAIGDRGATSPPEVARYRVRRALESADPGERHADLLRSEPESWPVGLLALCLRECLPDILRGRLQAPVRLADEGAAHLPALMIQSSGAEGAGALRRRLVESLASSRPRHAPLRVLELPTPRRPGAVDRAAAVLDALDRDNVEWTLAATADVELAELEAEREACGSKRAPTVERLDLDDENGALRARHDLVLIESAAALLERSGAPERLRRLGESLARGALLAAGDGIRPSRFERAILGPLLGWPAADADGLRQVLRDAGFEELESDVATGSSASAHRPTGIFRPPTKAEAPQPTPGSAGRVALVVSDPRVRAATTTDGRRRDLAGEIAESLRNAGAEPVRVAAPNEDSAAASESWRRALDGLAAGGPVRAFLDLRAVDASRGEASSIEGHETLAMEAVALARSLASSPRDRDTPLWLVTAGAQAPPVGDHPLALAQTPLAGVARVMRSELREVDSRHVDLSIEATAVEIEQLTAEILGGGDEDLVALREGGRWVGRIDRLALDDETGAAVGSAGEPASEGERLVTTRAGVLERLAWTPVRRRGPGPGEVEIEVRAAGLNFRDVMKALGVYPTEAGDAEQLGDECAGVVVAAGEGAELEVGSRVMALSPHAFSSHVTLPSSTALAIPDGMTFEEAATLLTAHLTALYALVELGRMHTGERVLIHAAAGGVGLAAVRIAQSSGAEVFGTAGSEAKRRLLRELGVRHVFDSRSLEFGEQVLDATGGEGVDLVLNSLAGEAIAKSLECLREHGRFLEIGKRDIYENSRIGLRPFRKSLSFFAVDLARMTEPERLAPMLEGVSALIADGTIAPLPYTRFPKSRVGVAFHTMARGRHLGKVVVGLADEPSRLRAAPPTERRPRLDADATYWIVGGLRGFGLELARWMAARGARHLVLSSRSGTLDERAAAVVEELTARGVAVHARASDVADADQTERLLTDIRDRLPPLRGVVHAAVAYRDCPLTTLTEDAFLEVAQAKITGAWNLHRLTLDLPLELFVLCSSVAALVGNPGQAAYVAANVFLEALAEQRRRQGLPALAVGWDRLRESGHVARNPELGEHLTRRGFSGLDDEEAFEALDELLTHRVTSAVVTRTDWGAFLESAGALARSPRFEPLRDAGGGVRGAGDLTQHRLAELSPEHRREAIAELLLAEVARTLRVPAERLRRDAALQDQGLDSLLAVELMSAVESRLGAVLPATALLDNPTIDGLSQVLADALGRGSDSEPSAPAAEPSPDESPANGSVVADIDQLCRDLERELAERERADARTGGGNGGPPRRGPDGPILLTGATGFVGAFVLDTLLGEDGPDVQCLVRADDPAAAFSKLEEARRRFGLPALDAEQRRRVVALSGDLARPRLGLPRQAWNRLSEETASVFHGGAEVNHLAGYRQLRAANVLGTREILRLATTGRHKTLHFASSVAVFSPTAPRGDGERLEEHDHDPLDSLSSAYAQTKAASERLIGCLSGNGSSPFVYRIGPVVGDGRVGAISGHDIVWRIVKAAITVGCAPDNDIDLGLTPVDYLSLLIGHCIRNSAENGAEGGVYHLVHPQPVSLNDLFEVARARGYRLETLPQDTWYETIRSTTKEHALTAYVALYPPEKLREVLAYRRLPALDGRRARGLLREAAIEPPPLDRRLDLYFDYLQSTGFLPAPDALEASPA